MNTQRPEWNDANNALVGYGVSMVTLCYMRRYLDFCAELFTRVKQDGFELSTEVANQFREMHDVLQVHAEQVAQGFDASQRRVLLDALGGAGSRYRDLLYRDGLSGDKSAVTARELVDFLKLAKEYLDQSIAANRRDDGLYHSYNLMQLDGDGGVSLRHLDEMLEGQVAVLASGNLDVPTSLDLLKALRSSALYREDQHSYLLYPDRDLPRFMQKNILPDRLVGESSLIQQMLAQADNRLVSRDAAGNVRFNPAFRNAAVLADALADCPPAERDRLLEGYEAVFDHQSFTGRSGTFFKYEGLGCIYWHMVSKLLLSVQEICVRARVRGDDPKLVEDLVQCYRAIQRGIGTHKSVSEQGAFPTDPYSHTPSMMGAQQPGLTGQVKEDFMARMIELGIRVEAGCIHFDPFLLSDAEFLAEPVDFAGVTVGSGSVAATFCKVPVLIRKADRQGIRVIHCDGRITESDALCLDPSTSREVFARNGSVTQIEVSVVR